MEVALEYLNQHSFEALIEDIVWELDINYFDAILKFCERNQLEPSDITKLISKPLKEKIEVDCIEDGLLPKKATLPI